MSYYWLLLPAFVVVIVVLGVLLRIYLGWPTRWCRSQRCLVGKTAVITGANTGLGFETALDFAKRGAKVILACRNRQLAEEARHKIFEETDNPNIFTKIVDFSSFDSVRAFTKELTLNENRLDILVNNVGISFADDTKSADGHDLTMQVNYYAHFLVTHLLIELMLRSGKPSRVVNISSKAAAHAKSFDLDKFQLYQGNVAAYVHSKLCLILFTKELARRLQATTITSYSLHPGAVKTGILRQTTGVAKKIFQLIVALFYKPLKEGAQTIIYCSVEKNIEQFNGSHFDNCRKVADYRRARDLELPSKLWKLTEDIVQLKETEKIQF